MDRKCDKEIKKVLVLLLFLLAGLLFLSLSYLWFRNQENHRLAAELCFEYPETEGIWFGIREKSGETSHSEEEIKEKAQDLEEKYGYHFLNTRESLEFRIFLAGELLLTSVVFVVVCLVFLKKEKAQEKRRREHIREMENCLLALIDGTYDLPPFSREESGEFTNLEELLQKLGTSAENLKERLETEEVNTKAFITDVSHQLKTPLSALQLSYEMLGEENLTEEEQREFYTQGKHEIEKLVNLMELLLNMSRLEGNMIHLKPEVRNLKETLLEAVNTVIMKAMDKDIQISAKISDCMVKHDFRWTQEAVINILDNAIKYSFCGGEIRIRTKLLTSYVLIEIADEGIGVQEEEKHKIFQRFYRGTQAKEVERDGAGVGLYLARKILEEQGGTISVKTSRIEKGSCFRIMLPLQ